MRLFVNRFVRDEQAQDLIEYGLLIGIITVGCVTLIDQIGPIVEGFQNLLDALSAAG